MSETDKPLIWIQGNVKTPPFSTDARMKAGFLLRRLQKGICWKYRIPGRCHPLEKIVMNFASSIKIKRGASSISLMMMPLSYWRSSRRKHKRRRSKSLIYAKSGWLVTNGNKE